MRLYVRYGNLSLQEIQLIEILGLKLILSSCIYFAQMRVFFEIQVVQIPTVI